MTRLDVTDASVVGEVRRAVVTRAAQSGLDEQQAGTMALLVTEAGSNLVKHAGGGSILFRLDEQNALDLLALDRGPGLSDAALALVDGYSTAGTAGLGLGSLHRLATRADLHSQPGTGTALYVRYQTANQAACRAGLLVGGFTVSKPGEEVCGDHIAIHHVGGRTVFLVCDGLGHGRAARDAALAAARGCRDRLDHGLTAMMRGAHDAARATRGAAVCVVEVDPAAATARCCGVGNIAARIVAPERTFHLVSTNGIVGAQISKVQEFTYPWQHGSVLVMHSDGLQSRWSLDRYQGWRRRHPLLIAGLLYRDFTRGHDDAALLVAREPGPDGDVA